MNGSRKLVAVKLTAPQWDLVVEAVREWGGLCDSEADMADGSREKGKAKRAKQLDALSTRIYSQAKRDD